MDSTTEKLIKSYINKAENKLSVAQRLYDSKDYEDSVSRAYYEVFHASQALLLTEGQKAETHKGVVTLFGLLFVRQVNSVKSSVSIFPILKMIERAGIMRFFHLLMKKQLKLL